jgi:hypothetical protein
VAGGEVHRRHPVEVAVGQQVLSGRVRSDGEPDSKAAGQAQVGDQPEPVTSRGAVLIENLCVMAAATYVRSPPSLLTATKSRYGLGGRMDPTTRPVADR